MINHKQSLNKINLEENEITVTISGKLHSGKTTISEILLPELIRYGIQVKYESHDKYIDFENTPKKLEALSKKNTKVTIKEVQLSRSSM